MNADDAAKDEFWFHNRFGDYMEPDFPDGRRRRHFLSIGYKEGEEGILVAPEIKREDRAP